MDDDGRAHQVCVVDGETAREERAGWRLNVRGTVQGVGFRPFVYRLASELGLDGSVRNAGGNVLVDVAADQAALAEFVRRVETEAPPLAQVRNVGVARLAPPPVLGAGFRILLSERTGAVGNEVPPDIAPCDDCLAELCDPSDRRYRYPFINCTNCGPRATIIDGLPYDRSRTAMSGFPLCPQCRCEYDDPTDRRFHAEPVTCPGCGPVLTWAGTSLHGNADGADALAMAEDAIRHGAIVALKGLGGYQLVCDATRQDVVRRLRARKYRPAKPLAVMVADLPAALEIADLDDVEQELLVSRARPIVLARAKSSSVLAPGVHDGTPRVGVFLPNTPLHYLLLNDLRRPMVVTSGNITDEPMAIADDDARRILGGVANGFLMHDRPIRARYDDSVAQVTLGRARLIRRARGYAPELRVLPTPATRPLLAAGAELKHTFTLAEGNAAVVSPHIGDLENAEVYAAFTAAVRQLSDLLAIKPELVVHDLHPSYLSTQFARTWRPDQRIGVQHHHAHVAACAAEFDISRPFIGIAYDGLGMGDDGTLWGGEVLIADLRSYRRIGRFSRAPLPGGAAAVRRPLRMALGYLLGAETFAPHESGRHRDGLSLEAAVDDVLERAEEREVAVVRQMLAAGVNCPVASSAGRLFDAVASLLGLRDDTTFEGEAAIALENAALHDVREELPWCLRRVDGVRVYDVRPTLQATVDGVRRDLAASLIAARFHNTIVAVTAAFCDAARAETGLRTVCLGGGVFQNQTLAAGVLSALRESGFEAFLGEQVPANDGGISFGQAAIGAALTGRG